MPQPHEHVKEPNKSSDPFDHPPESGETSPPVKKQGIKDKIEGKLTDILDRQGSPSTGDAEAAPDRAQRRTTYTWNPKPLKPIVNSPNPTHIGQNSESGQGKVAADVFANMSQSHEYNLKIPWWDKHVEEILPDEGDREPLVPGPEPQPEPQPGPGPGPEPEPEPEPKPGPKPQPGPKPDDKDEMKAIGPGPTFDAIGPSPTFDAIGPGPNLPRPHPGPTFDAIGPSPTFDAIGPGPNLPRPHPGPRNKEITSRPQFKAIEGPKQGPMRPQSSRPTPRELTAAGREEASDRVMPFKVTTLGERQNEQTTGHKFPWLSATAPHQMRDRPGGETMSIPAIRTTMEHPAVVHGAQGGPMLSRGQRTGGAARIADIFRPGGTFRPGGGSLIPKRGKPSESPQQASVPPTATSTHGNLYSVPVDMSNLHRGPGDKGPKVDMTNLFREPND